MRIGLIDVDGHHFPNLALMKLAAWHKKQGDTVEWYNGIERYDTVYKSKVFTFTPDDSRVIQAGKVIEGGTGYKRYDIRLPCEVEHVQPDYSLYPQTEWFDGKTAYGFLTRGCIRKCPWCIVPKKEGGISIEADIEDILQSKKRAILLDNNILASGYGISQLEKIAKIGCKVDFNQGLDARLVTEEIAGILSEIKWISLIRFACDTLKDIDPLLCALEKLNKQGVKNYRVFVYMLVRDIKDAQERSEQLKNLGVVPFAQPYRDFSNTPPTREQRDFARYVNRKEIYRSTSWEGFKSSGRG
jgi:hypothetical protein